MARLSTDSRNLALRHEHLSKVPVPLEMLERVVASEHLLWVLEHAQGAKEGIEVRGWRVRRHGFRAAADRGTAHDDLEDWGLALAASHAPLARPLRIGRPMPGPD